MRNPDQPQSENAEQAFQRDTSSNSFPAGLILFFGISIGLTIFNFMNWKNLELGKRKLAQRQSELSMEQERIENRRLANREISRATVTKFDANHRLRFGNRIAREIEETVFPDPDMIAAYHYMEDHSPNGLDRVNAGREGRQTIKGYVPSGEYRLQLFCKELALHQSAITSNEAANITTAEQELNFKLVGPLKFQMNFELEDREFSDAISIDLYRGSFENKAGHESKTLSVSPAKANGNRQTSSISKGMPFFPGTLNIEDLHQEVFRSAPSLTHSIFSIEAVRKENDQPIRFVFTTRVFSDVDDCLAISDVINDLDRISMYAGNQKLDNLVDICQGDHTLPLLPDVGRRRRELPILSLDGKPEK